MGINIINGVETISGEAIEGVEAINGEGSLTNVEDSIVIASDADSRVNNSQGELNSENTINNAVERIFVREFIFGLARFVREAPFKLLAQICAPLWETGTGSDDPEAVRKKFFKRAQSGFYPISIMGLSATSLISAVIIRE